MHVYQVSFRRRPLSSKMLMLDVANPKKSVGTSLSTVTKGDKEIGVSATQFLFRTSVLRLCQRTPRLGSMIN